jgi:protein phosphatase
MEMAAITHMGNVRENNEDAYYLDTEQGRLFAIADGMGGHNAGEVASQMAIDKMLEIFKGESFDCNDIVTSIRETFEKASAEIDASAKQNSQYEGMGTTLTLVYVAGEIIYVGHIGDSRAYLMDSSGIRPITRDHTLVSELVRTGSITQTEARNHPQRNVIMKALGSDCKSIPDIFEVEIEEKSIVVICSDGLSDLVDDHEIAESVQQSPSLVEAVGVLKDLALSRGGHDNITIVAASINGLEEVK